MMMQHIASIIRPEHLRPDVAIRHLDSLKRFGRALHAWLPIRERALCLTCMRAPFAHEYPAAFFLVEFAIEHGEPRELGLSAICQQCGTRTDNELRRAGCAKCSGRSWRELRKNSSIRGMAGWFPEHEADE
jgi:hypothetical protein